MEEILCLKFSIRLDFVRPLESPSIDEVTLDRSPPVSLACSGPGVGVRVGVNAGVGGRGGAGVGLNGAGVGVNSGFDGIGGGETKAVLSAFFTRASAAASLSLSAFCCFRMRSTAKKSSQADQKEKGASKSPLYPRLRKARRSVDSIVMNNKASLTL